ncbi:MAG: cytochrome-c peroxidase [Planctomycetota bacterium]|jgi:cytochrome c peroxidase
MQLRIAHSIALALPAALALGSFAPTALAQGGPPPPPPGGGALQDPPVPPGNPITAEKAILGKLLFWEEQLSSDNTMACGTCHIPGAGGSEPRLGPATIHPGVDGLQGTDDDIGGSPGVRSQNAFGHYTPSDDFEFDEQVTGRWAQTTFMTPYSPEAFWDGRAEGTFIDPVTGQVILPGGGALESQSLGPILSDVEMAQAGRTLTDAMDKLALVEPLALATDLPADMAAAIAGDASYGDLFEAAFGTPEITPVRLAFALATYQRTLIPDQTPFDLDQLTAQQQQGLNAFNGPGRCNACHTAPTFSSFTFRNVGLRPWQEDSGRMEVTGLFADRGKFKVPSLRNVGLRTRFFHNGSLQHPTLQSAVAFYNGGGGDFPENKDPLLLNPAPIQLSPGQIADITAFLEDGLTDPRVAAETFPFDRPTLHSEQGNAFSSPFGLPLAGSGGEVPRQIASAPALLGSQDFKLGLRNALGGSVAVLAVSAAQAPAGTTVNAAPVHVDAGKLLALEILGLAGVGEGEGFATHLAPLPNEPTLVGVDIFSQWLVFDPAAPGELAASRGQQLTFL